MKNDKNVILIQSPMDRPGLQVDVNETPLFEPRIPSVATFSALQERSSSTMMEETQPNFQSSTATPSVVLTRSEVNETLDRIKSNQEYQAVLQEALKTLNKALERNRQLQKDFQKEANSKPKNSRATVRLKLEMSPFKAPTLKMPPVNDSDDEDEEGEEDTTSFGNVTIKRCHRSPYFLDPYGNVPVVPAEPDGRGIIYPEAPMRKKRIIQPERLKLRQLVRQQNQQLLFSQLYSRTMDAGESLTHAQVDQFEAEKRRISEMSELELEQDPSHIDWEAIQESAFPNRTPHELEADWRLFCDPKYLRTPWTPEEDEQLISVARTFHERHWDRIATAMENKRLPVQYLTRYQQALRPRLATDSRETTTRSYSVKTTGAKASGTRGTAAFQVALEKGNKRTKRKRTSLASAGDDVDEDEDDDDNDGNAAVVVTAKSGVKWTPEEDDLLRDAIKKYGEKNWASVATLLGGLRTGQQCLHRWQKTLNPNIRRGKWEASEDTLLTMAVKAYGAGNWRLIHKHVPGRTDVQCRERWVNVLDPAVQRSEGWTRAEDSHLLAVTKAQPAGKWSLVAKAHNEGMMAIWSRSQNSGADASKNASQANRSQVETAPTNAAANDSPQTVNGEQISVDSSTMPTASPSTSMDITPSLITETTTVAPTNDENLAVDSHTNVQNATQTPTAVPALAVPSEASRTVESNTPAPTSPAAKPPPMRTDNQCWRRWKVLRGGNSNRGRGKSKPSTPRAPRAKKTSSEPISPNDSEVVEPETPKRPKRKRSARKVLDWAKDDSFSSDEEIPLRKPSNTNFYDSDDDEDYEHGHRDPISPKHTGSRVSTPSARAKAAARPSTAPTSPSPALVISRVTDPDALEDEAAEPQAKRRSLKIVFSKSNPDSV